LCPVHGLGDLTDGERIGGGGGTRRYAETAMFVDAVR